MIRDPWSRLVRAWLLTALIDGLFSSVLAVAFYGSTATRLFQGVASTLLGPTALTGGTSTALVGLLMHIGVALGWSTVFLLLAMRSSWIRSVLATRLGVLRIASVYGPCIWMVMSLIIVPFLLHRPPTFNIRWWVQFFGHIPFVALPIVWSIASGLDRDLSEAG